MVYFITSTVSIVLTVDVDESTEVESRSESESSWVESSSSSQNFCGAFYKIVRPRAPYNMEYIKMVKK